MVVPLSLSLVIVDFAAAAAAAVANDDDDKDRDELPLSLPMVMVSLLPSSMLCHCRFFSFRKESRLYGCVEYYYHQYYCDEHDAMNPHLLKYNYYYYS